MCDAARPAPCRCCSIVTDGRCAAKLDGTRIQATNVLNMHDQYYHYLHNTEAATSASGHAHGQQTDYTAADESTYTTAA